MRIIRTERGEGKTTALIKQAHRENKYILCHGKGVARYIYEKSKDMGLTIPFPIAVSDLLNGSLRDCISSVLIDEIDYVLPQLLRGIQVDAITTSSPIDTLKQDDTIKIKLQAEIENFDKVKQQINELQDGLNSLRVDTTIGD